MLKKIYFWLFAILYLVVAFTSGLHAFDFFGLANNEIMAVMLACAFEIGQAAVLFSLLTSPKERNKIMPWVLMGILTLVQILGNVYSSYKYIMLNSLENLRWFKEPIFIWTELPDDQATVIVTWVIGAILPLVALLLTAMVTNQLETDKDNPIIKDILTTEENLEKAENLEEFEKIEEQLSEPVFGISREDIQEQKNEIPEKTGFVNI